MARNISPTPPTGTVRDSWITLDGTPFRRRKAGSLRGFGEAVLVVLVEDVSRGLANAPHQA